jgi:hypothetical protein
MKNLMLAALILASSHSFAQVPPYVPTTGLVGWYPFTGNANNAAGTGKNGTVNGPVTTSDRFGNPGSAYYFNGHSDNILIDTAFFNTGWHNYTISVWLNSDSTSNPYNYNHNQSLINTIPHQGLEIYYNWGGLNNTYGLLAGSNPAGTSWNIFFLRPTVEHVASHVWKHIVLVKTEDASYHVYINGALDTTHTTTISAIDYYNKLIIGNTDPSVITEGFWGKLDDYGIWNTALTACDIKRLYNSSPYLYLGSQPLDQSISEGATATFSVTSSGTGLSYQWKVDTGTGFIDVPSAAPYSGVTSASLSIFPVTSSMNAYKYRCVVAGECADSSKYGILSVTPSAVVETKANRVSFVPNPTKGEIAFSGVSKDASVFIYNTLGQLVFQGSTHEHISIAQLPAGVYHIRLMGADGNSILFEKIVKE